MPPVPRPDGELRVAGLLAPPPSAGIATTIVQPQADGTLLTIALAPPAVCIEACIKLAHDLDTVWQLTGMDADPVHGLWIGTPPAAMPRDAALRVLQPSAALRAGLPRVDEIASDGRRGVPVYVIDPNGFVILRYPPGFDPAGLRTDLSRLLKLM
jgi:hypothetical protein